MHRHSTARWLLLLALLLPLSTRPALAAESPHAHVLLDVVISVIPPSPQGLCLNVEPGELSVTVQRVRDAVEQPRPAHFSLNGRMIDPDAVINLPISNRPITTTTPVTGASYYCWDVSIDAPETATMPNAQRGGYIQRIAVMIVHRPA